jgi:hypothetical protein
MTKLKVFLLLIFLPGIYFVPAEVYGQKWIYKSFQDFTKGSLDASGQNIYINSKGEIKTIRRFDLNNDGFVDLLFNSTHDDDVSVPASITTVSAGRQLLTKPLQVEGSIASDISDLNKDEFPDIVFCPNANGAQTAHRYVTIIYGGADGWPPERSNGLLPVNDVKAVLVADLNGDRWPDIITLNSAAWLPGQPSGNIARVYWGGEHGFLLTRFQDIGVGQAFRMVSEDFDGDGAADVAFLTETNTIKFLWGSRSIKTRAVLKNDKTTAQPFRDGSAVPNISFSASELTLPGKKPLSIAVADVNKDGKIDLIEGSGNNTLYIIKGKGGRGWGAPEPVSNIDASSITAGDIDDDGNTDLVVARFSVLLASGGEMKAGINTGENNIKILWGNKGNFSASDMTPLDAPFTAATAIADLDGDGHPDIVCATYQGKTTFTTESIIYFGKENRKFQRSEKGITSSGAFHVSVIPAGKNNAAAVAISNSKTGTLNEEVPLLLYYGSASGFKKDNRLEIPFFSGYQSSAADLNEDGFVDLVAINSMHGGQTDNPYRGVNIFWGAKNGFDFKNRRTVLNEKNASTSNIADLNKDGYLDIIVGFFDEYDKSPTKLVIYYGSAKGYELKNRVSILSEGRSSSPTVADYNKDGWLDIAVSSYTNDRIRIFWGGPKGFTEKHQQAIFFPSVIDLETADLNSDGYLDLIASSYNDKINLHHDSGVEIFWGGPNGFKEWNAQWLPGNTVLGTVAADFDKDGYPDLFFPSYHADITRESLPMYLYWGGPNGFTVTQRTTFIGDSGADALAADFDHDGKIDLAVASHATNGFHTNAVSKIYYNDGNRFQSSDMKIDSLPSPGCHWMWNYDMGNIYTRKSEQTYTSAPINWTKNNTHGKITDEAVIPTNTSLIVAVRSAITEDSICKKDWKTVDTNNFTVGVDDRYMQYKLILSSGNGDRYPVVSDITVDLY